MTGNVFSAGPVAFFFEFFGRGQKNGLSRFLNLESGKKKRKYIVKVINILCPVSVSGQFEVLPIFGVATGLAGAHSNCKVRFTKLL